MITQDKWKWWGFAGHFVCGNWCRFHLCTEIGEYVVSTVGKLVYPSDSGSESQEHDFLTKHPNGREIGWSRFYETMVFRFNKRCDAPECMCGAPLIDPTDLDFEGYYTPAEANAGHLRMCERWAEKLEQS